MTFLAARDSGGPASSRELASLFDVSEAHLSKVMQRLVRGGLLKSTRGAYGGFVLARDGGSISLLEVYEAVDGPVSLSECLFEKPVCKSGRCIMGSLVSDTNKRVRDYLSGTMLSDLSDVYDGG